MPGRFLRPPSANTSSRADQWNEDAVAYVSRLEVALDNMSQGLTMFDADSRIVLCNERYLQMYGLSEAIAKRGCTLHDLIRHRQEMGSFSGDPAAYCAEILQRVAAGRTTSILVEAPGGLIVHLIERPLPDGGWVVTHEDVTTTKRAEAQVVHMAHHDMLTELPNRVLFRARLDAALQEIGNGAHVAVHYLDLDNFKSTNDTVGHPVGDGLLRAVAARLRTCVRDEDTVARVGGDEFAIVQTRIRCPSEVTELAQRVRSTLMGPYEVGHHQVLCDTSIGIALAPRDGVAADQLIRNADLALYAAKGAGRGTYRFFEPEMHRRLTLRRSLELDLRRALEGNQFELHYQPLVSSVTGDTGGCEALVRWRHPERGLVPPSDFIFLAEETGLINQLGEWVLRNACAEAARWPVYAKVAVNVSPIQFRGSKLAQIVAGALEASGLPPARLEIEITESALMQNIGPTLDTLHILRDLGVRIALDDFGTGYSSLSYLRTFPFDKIKIDRSFIKDVSEPRGATAVVSAIVALAACFGMTTTVEGIETEQQRDIARSSGCSELQGYLFSPPVPASAVMPLFAAGGRAVIDDEPPENPLIIDNNPENLVNASVKGARRSRQRAATDAG